MESMEIIEEVQCQIQEENLSGNSDGISPKRRRLSSSLNSSKKAPKLTEEYDLHCFIESFSKILFTLKNHLYLMF